MPDKPVDAGLLEKQRWKNAEHLNGILNNCLDAHTMEIDAQISMFRLFDVISRWERDMRRLAVGQPSGVNPLKHIAYQAFWIRKIKPVSNAYRQKDIKAAAGGLISPAKELVDINERLAIHVAIKNLISYCEAGFYPSPENPQAIHRRPVGTDNLRAYIGAYLSHGDGDGATTYENLIYNQRYRTFGPHHFTHILEQMVFGAMQVAKAREEERELIRRQNSLTPRKS